MHLPTTFELLLFSVSIMKLAQAACCHAHANPGVWKPDWPDDKDPNLCDDDTALGGGNACCGRGKCNLFCCACQRGCRGHPDRRNHGSLLTANDICPVNDGSITIDGHDCAEQMFAATNTAENGSISLDEFLKWAMGSSNHGTGGAISVVRWTARFHSFDANGDGLISPEEMHEQK